MENKSKQDDVSMNIGSEEGPTNSTANIVKMIDDSIRRMTDIHNLTKEFTGKLINAEVKRIDDLSAQSALYIDKIRVRDNDREDDLRDEIEQRLNQALQDHKIYVKNCHSDWSGFTDKIAAERELRLLQKFDSLDKAIEKADVATDKRFDAVNEFRSTLADQQRTFLPRTEFNGSLSAFTERLSSIEKRVEKAENLKQGASYIWAYLLGAVGLVTGLVTFLLNKLG